MEPTGRADLLAAVEEHLAHDRRVALRGVPEVGLSAVLSEVRRRAGRTAILVTAPAGPDSRHAVLAEVLAAVPQQRLAMLPPPQRRAVDVVLRRVDGEPDQVALRFAATELLRHWTLLVIDDAQLTDQHSADVLAYAVRRIPLRLLVGAGAGAGTLATPPADVEITVPPLAVEEVAALLTAHGLPCGHAAQVHHASGGLPGWALEIGRSEGIPARVSRRLAVLPAETRATMLLAALAREPTVAMLRRAGRSGADRHLEPARAAGLVEIGATGEVSFTAAVIADALTREASWSQRTDGHRALAGAVERRPERARHRALALDVLDTADVLELTDAAALARAGGDRLTAAELGLLAARGRADDATPVLVTAARDAAAAGQLDLARQAAAHMERDGTPAARVRARLAIIEAMGQDMQGSLDTFAGALAEAQGDPLLEAEVHLLLAIKANVADGDPVRALAAAGRAAELSADGEDRDLHAAALAMRARIERITGHPGAEDTLALALAVKPTAGALINVSPQFLAARHALFDDRLGESHTILLGLLPLAERSGVTGDLVDILRGLAEVEVRSGRCGPAMAHAARALHLTESAGLSLGPAWYTAAVAEAAGGSMHRALAYATHGAGVSKEEHDVIFLARNLHLLGQVRLAGGDLDGAQSVLEQVRDLEHDQRVVDPSVLRWHGDLATAFALAGRSERARGLIEEVRPVAVRLGRTGVVAALSRAEGLLLSAEGDLPGAGELLEAAATAFADLGLIMEHGRTLLNLADVARRRRRRTAARAALTEASGIFAAAQARPWLRLTREAATRLDAAAAPASPLTSTEQRVAVLVAEGASNREISATLFLSVKTVEATLTRVYRKLGVRTRTQLGISMTQGISPFPPASKEI